MTSYNIYFTGDLFNHKDLVGNALLAHYLKKCSNGKYLSLLAQDGEQTTTRSVDIRNQDLKMVISSDIGIYNFDGTDLDSGTVVEFMCAKFFDLPALLLRTDFRNSGDGMKDCPPWNLMATGYPRSKVLVLHGMEEYQKSFKGKLDDPISAMEDLYRRISMKIIPVLDEMVREKSVYKFESFDDAVKFYKRAAKFAGDSFEISLEEGFFEKLVKRKLEKGLIQVDTV